MAREKILVVDDEKGMREMLKAFFEEEGYIVDVSPNGNKALELIERSSYDLVITDMVMPQMDGIKLMKKMKEKGCNAITIMITAYATAESAVEAMKLGAYDYIIKPFKLDELRIIVRNALDKRRLERENILLRKEVEKTYCFENIIGKSPSMLSLFELIKKVSGIKVNVLIVGESGTGKELVARAIHFNSPRKDGPFIAINCSAIPPTLLESELFGHVKGAFTGAISNKEGLFELANGGTIFLDEICEIPPSLQVKLLRAIQEKSFRRVGGVEDIEVDVRIISATNRDIELEVKEGRFRDDLYYRLNVIQIRIPPLRERKEDIPLLVEHFIKKFSSEFNKDIKGIKPEAMRILMSYDFPGNVRELENFIERAVALESGEYISEDVLPEELRGRFEKIPPFKYDIPPEGIDLEKTLSEIERHILLQALKKADGVQKKAASLLNLTPRSFRYRLEKYGVYLEEEEEGG